MGRGDARTTNFSSATFSVLVGNGTGGFKPAYTIPSIPTQRSLASVDVNGDGKPDVLLVSSQNDTMQVLLNTSQ